MNRVLIPGVFLIATFCAAGAAAQCFVAGDISAAPSGDPGLPAWKYTLEVTWDTGSRYAVSHIDLQLDPVGGTCSCQDFRDVLTYFEPAGSSTGETYGEYSPCTVRWDAFLECKGDPSIPGVGGILLKFEPAGPTCEPGTAGTASIDFYSDLGPVPVAEDIISMTDKFGLHYCFGSLTGVFPGLACNPVPNEGAIWGTVKGLYR